jgi:apolipoprotein N-acyltransferase
MKSVLKSLNLKMLVTLIIFTAIQTVLWAQDAENTTTSTKKVDVSVENTETWYASPWVWVIGAAVFILLLVALLSGGRSRSTSASSDRVTVTKTVERDTDV